MLDMGQTVEVSPGAYLGCSNACKVRRLVCALPALANPFKLWKMKWRVHHAPKRSYRPNFLRQIFRGKNIDDVLCTFPLHFSGFPSLCLPVYNSCAIAISRRSEEASRCSSVYACVSQPVGQFLFMEGIFFQQYLPCSGTLSQGLLWKPLAKLAQDTVWHRKPKGVWCDRKSVWTHISLGHRVWCQHGAFSGVGAFVASFVPAECPRGGGMWSIFGKPFKRAIWNSRVCMLY